MYTRSINDVEKVEWGAGTSQRVLTAEDPMGFAVAHTVVRKGTSSRLQYRNHLEACYCIGGSGTVWNEDRSQRYDIVPGTIYVLDQHDKHYLEASDDEDLILVSIFNPPITGKEKHTLSEDGFSSY
ncbi:ectoine synthase [Brachybacterium sp. EF45031]|uniref:ectoine synthase n=1 Tax=Brachybacterium sillae TaxID=2810536 RepID=UPI00217E1F4D|nr:ectoine synthase [Brachybacterium sillae]MCS6711126.1 ectoine synthase [Brachybacterium sillae]